MGLTLDILKWKKKVPALYQYRILNRLDYLNKCNKLGLLFLRRLVKLLAVTIVSDIDFPSVVSHNLYTLYLLPALCLLLWSKMSRRGQANAIGIDLGTTYSCVAAWFDQHNRVEILPNEQGNNTTPSCVACNDTELLVGEGAKNQITRNPTNTVFGKFLWSLTCIFYRQENPSHTL